MDCQSVISLESRKVGLRIAPSVEISLEKLAWQMAEYLLARDAGHRLKILSLFETAANLAGLFSVTYAIIGRQDRRITIADRPDFRFIKLISATFSCLFSYISRLR
ncbi:hypothetical protein [Agrobacterium burrii]